MPCTCNAICDNDCNDNVCSGHVPVCANDFPFTGVAIGNVIRASHLLELQTAIDTERTDSGRRFNAAQPVWCSSDTGQPACSQNDFSAYSWTPGVGVNNPIDDQHFNDIKLANNEVVLQSGSPPTGSGLITTDFISQDIDGSPGKVDSIIKAADLTDLQNKINVTRNACICDSHCNCDGNNCGCNGECPSDDYYYYYYYYYS